MYQSKIRANKNRRRGRHDSRARELVEPEPGQLYAIVTKMMGNGRLSAACSDGTERLGRIRGCMRKYSKKVIIDRGDLILVCERDFEKDKVDVVHKYTHEEATRLMKDGELGPAILKAMQQVDVTNSLRPVDGEDLVVFQQADGPSDSESDTRSGSGSDGDGDGEDSLDIDAI